MRATRKLMTIIFSALLLLLAVMGAQASAEEQIEIEVHHLLIREVGEGLEVREIITIQNSGEEIEPTEENPETLRISLPFSYTTLVFNAGVETEDDFEATGDGLALLVPIEPGEINLDFTYILKPHNQNYVLDKEIYYPTESIHFLLTEGLTMTDENLVHGGLLTMGEIVVNQYSWEEPAPGERFMSIISREEAESTGALERGYSSDGFHSEAHLRFWRMSPFSGVEPHLFLLVLVAIIGAAVYFTVKYTKKSDKTNQDEGNTDQVKQLEAKQQILLRKLADLKRQHQAGEIDDDRLEKLTKAYKEKLKEVKIQLKQMGR